MASSKNASRKQPYNNIFSSKYCHKIYWYDATVPLIYNFTFTHVYTHGAMQDFMWK